MKVYGTQDIRNLSVVGHGDAGKTSLIAAMIYVTGASSRLGRVDDGTAPTDFDEEAIAHKVSLNLAPAYVEYMGKKINLLDTPGYTAFIAHARPALNVSEAALVVLDGINGVEVNAEKVWEFAAEYHLPAFIFINKLDKERSDFGTVLGQVRATFGRKCMALTMPIGREKDFRGVVDVVRQKAYEYDDKGQPREIAVPEEGRGYMEEAREQLIEMVAESDDALMEKFFEQGTLTEEELLSGIRTAIAARELTPVFAGSSVTLKGVATILEGIAGYAPAPPGKDSEAPSAFVFRTMAETFGRITVMKVKSGTIKSDATLYNAGKSASERLGPLHAILGKSLEKITEAHSGDIVAVSKLKETVTGDTLCEKLSPITYPPIIYPEAALAYAVVPRTRHDEDKLSSAIHKILEEDPQLHYERDEQTKEFLLAGSGQQHIEIVVERLRNRYGVEVELHLPKVPYRETIKATIEAQGRHKKQSGGRGQFGDCKCIFQPLARGGGFEFEDKIFGGAIPAQWRPAVEKGIKDAAARGYLAGYPVVDFKVQLIDGSYHTVDSDDLSFQMAGRKAFKVAIEKAHPVLLEPVMQVEVVAPQDNSGDIMGDLNSRRGRIQGMDSRGAQQVIKAQVPMAEMLNYPQTLNSITGGRGTYHMEFSHYDEVPTPISQKIIQQAQAEGRVRKDEED
jgi:elongation factor G